MKQVQDVIERLWDFIDKLDINTFGKPTAFYQKPETFLRITGLLMTAGRTAIILYDCMMYALGKFLADNIVGSVVVFSLVFWIPLSILVHCVVRHCPPSSHQVHNIFSDVSGHKSLVRYGTI